MGIYPLRNSPMESCVCYIILDCTAMHKTKLHCNTLVTSCYGNHGNLQAETGHCSHGTVRNEIKRTHNHRTLRTAWDLSNNVAFVLGLIKCWTSIGFQYSNCLAYNPQCVVVSIEWELFRFYCSQKLNSVFTIFYHYVVQWQYFHQWSANSYFSRK